MSTVASPCLPILSLSPDGESLVRSGAHIKPNDEFELRHDEHAVRARLCVWGTRALVVVTATEGELCKHAIGTRRRSGNNNQLEQLLFEPMLLHGYFTKQEPDWSIKATHVLVPTATRSTQIGVYDPEAGGEEFLSGTYFAAGGYEDTEFALASNVEEGGSLLEVTRGHIRSGGEASFRHRNGTLNLWVVVFDGNAIISVLPSSTGVDELLVSRTVAPEPNTALQQLFWYPDELLKLLRDSLVDAHRAYVVIATENDPSLLLGEHEWTPTRDKNAGADLVRPTATVMA